MRWNTSTYSFDYAKRPLCAKGAPPTGRWGIVIGFILYCYLLYYFFNPSVCADAQPPPFHKGGKLK